MKNAYFKFACIFIIAMFCLAPLGAVDLNQNDNNTKYINQDDKETIIVDDANATDVDAKDDVSEIDSNTVDDKTSADAKELKTITANDSALSPAKNDDVNSTKSQEEKACPHLRAHMPSVKYGEAPVVWLYSEEGLNSYITIDSPAFEYRYKVPMKDGYMEYQFEECNLEPGTYEVKISTPGDSNYGPQEITTTFTVNTIQPNLTLQKINNIFYGEKAVINATSTPTFNATANIRIIEQAGRASEKIVPINFTKGKGGVAVENLTPGYYRTIIEFDGDDWYSRFSHETTFAVYGNVDPNLKVEVDDIQYSEHPVVKIHANESYDGIFEIKSSNSGKTYRTDLENGYVEYELPEDFKLGNFSVNIKSEGDLTFKPVSITNNFSVAKADPKLSIHVDDSYVNETTYKNQEVHVVVDAREKFSGNASITLNNRVYFKKIEIVNGHGEGIYSGGDFPGNYTVKVETEGNDYFLPGNCSSTYEVKKL